jgi:hypothetical protein
MMASACRSDRVVRARRRLITLGAFVCWVDRTGRARSGTIVDVRVSGTSERYSGPSSRSGAGDRVRSLCARGGEAGSWRMCCARAL